MQFLSIAIFPILGLSPNLLFERRFCLLILISPFPPQAKQFERRALEISKTLEKEKVVDHIAELVKVLDT